MTVAVKMLAQPRATTIELGALTRILTTWWYPRVFQIIGLAAFGLILYFSFLGNPHGELNFATVFTWRVWWALLPLSLFLVGKIWCALCPLATLSDLVQKFSPLARVAPRRLRENGAWVMAGLFVLLSWAHTVFDIHNTPWITGVVFVALALAAVLLALRYERRTFCRFVCPVGLMGGLYAMLSPLALRANSNLCRTRCANQVCRAAPNCKLYDYPRTLDSNRYCVVCAECVSACPHDSLKLIVRAPAREIAEIRNPVVGEAVLAVLLLGLVLVEIVRMTPLYPAFMQRALTLTPLDHYTLIYTLALAALLLLLISAALLVTRAASPKWKKSFASFAYAFIPLALAGHLGTNLFELSAEGTRSSQVILNSLNVPLVLFDLPPRVRGSTYASDPTLMVVYYVLIALGLLASLAAIYRIARKTQARALPHALFAAAMAALYFAVYSLPMKPGC